MNADPDFAKVQSSFLKDHKESRQGLSDFCRLSDGRGENKKYVLPDLAGEARDLTGKWGRFDEDGSNEVGCLVGAFAAGNQCRCRRFSQCLRQGFAGVHPRPIRIKPSLGQRQKRGAVCVDVPEVHKCRLLSSIGAWRAQ